MSAGIFRLEAPAMSPRERERIRQACIEEGLLDEDDLFDFDDVRIFTI
jgi:hypothetical protein